MPALVERRWAQALARPKRLSFLRALIIVILGVVALLPIARGLAGGSDLRAWVSADTPVDAVNYIRGNDLHGRIYQEIGAGSYMDWALWPQMQVFIDSRTNLYPADQWREYFEVWHVAEGYQEILDKYQIEYILADAFWQPDLLHALQKDNPRWELIFQSGESFLFRRRGNVIP